MCSILINVILITHNIPFFLSSCMFLKVSIFTVWLIRPCPSTGTPALGFNKFTKFGIFFIGHHYCIVLLSLSYLFPGVKKKIFKEIVHFHYNDLYGHTLAQEPLPRGSWNLQLWWTLSDIGDPKKLVKWFSRRNWEERKVLKKNDKQWTILKNPQIMRAYHKQHFDYVTYFRSNLHVPVYVFLPVKTCKSGFFFHILVQ